MAAQERSFVEICGFEREPRRRFREVNVSLGGPPGPGPGWGTFPDSAGAYHYEESGEMQSATRNRFIHWSSCGGVVQLEEACLDGDLLNGGVRLRFDGGVLPGAVCICETASSVGVLILTTRSAHRLLLPHPRRMYRSELVPEQSLQSVFTDVGRLGLEDPAHSAPLPPSAGLTGGPGATAAWLSPQGHAHFAVASPAGGVVLLTLPPQDAKGELLVVELRRSSVMRKLSGWLPSMRGDHPPGDLVLSLAVRELEADAFLFALCADHRLRMWSLKEQACLLEADLLDFLPSPRGPRPPSPAGPGGGGPPRLRLAFSPSTGLCLGVFLGGRRGQFTVLQLVADGERYSLEHISTLFSSQETLVDFTLTSSDVWALWVDEANAAVVKYISYEHSAAGQWNQVFVQPPPEEEVPIGVDLDPRETFLDILFSPLRFTAGAILRALQIFHRGSEGLLDPSWETLKKEVTLAVERKIQSSVTESEFSQEDYRQLQVEFWSRFYSCCLQYQEAEAAPLGLTVSPHSGMACLLRKGFLSFLLPCFAVDHLYLSSDEHLLTEDETPMAEDPEVGRDVLQLVQSLRLVSDAVTADMAYEMERAVEELQPPEKPAEQVLEEMLRSDSDNVIVDIQNKLQDVRNPVAAMMVLLREMDLETETDLGAEGAPGPGLSQLYAGTVAVSTVCQAVGHLAMTRARFCRDLLILQKLYLRFGDNVFLGGGAQLLQLQQDLIPRTSHLLSSYHVLRHASQRLATPTDSLDMNVLQLTHLELSDNPPTGPRPGPGPQTVVELFYRAGGRRCAVSHLLAETSGPAPLPWGHMTCSLVHLLAQLLWPSNPSFQFPEVLMAHCQYTQLQEYVRLVSPWCQVNIGSCRFMLAQCYLASGEGQKALQCFQEAANEVEKEDFLLRLTGSEENAPSPRLQFYNKVLRLLEDVGLPELVIQLASLAVTEATGDVSSQAALWTRVFRHHLALGHNSEAYEALTQNPDGGMQLDCLRQLVVVLCERRQLHDLVRFPYVGLHEEVVVIIESRARGLDLLTHNYYDLLYAFHIARHNYRKAGTVMLEWGMRLGRELRSPLGLQRQVSCYLAALTCLRLIRPQYAWMVQPAPGTTYERPGASPKRNADGELSEPAAGGRQVDILQLGDLQREYFLSRARLSLAQQHPPSAAIAGGASAPELLGLLVQAGLFDLALSLCQSFKLNPGPVYESLAFRCIQLQVGGEESQNEAWSWLAANQLSVVNTKESSAVEEAWRLLASYLDRNQSDKNQSANGQHLQLVLHKLLTHGLPPPDWLLQACKRVDPPSLLRLFLNFDLLEAAAELVLEYVDAVLGRGPQYFGIETPLSAFSPPSWLPYTSIDQLMQALGDSQTHGTLQRRLQDKMAEYHHTVRLMTQRRLAAQRRAAV